MALRLPLPRPPNPLPEPPLPQPRAQTCTDPQGPGHLGTGSET